MPDIQTTGTLEELMDKYGIWPDSGDAALMGAVYRLGAADERRRVLELVKGYQWNGAGLDEIESIIKELDKPV